MVSVPLVEASPAAANAPPETSFSKMTEGSPNPPRIEVPAPAANDTPEDLPNPDILNNSVPMGTEQPPMGVTDSTIQEPALESRLAPPAGDVVDPHPSVRQSAPSSSVHPSR